MAAPVEEGVLCALRGMTAKTTRLPKPLIIKVYVSSLKNEFREERRMMLELVGPELQSMYDDRQIEIEIVDMHFGTGPSERLMLEQDPYLLKDYLSEIETCHRTSKSVFFIALVGETIGRMCLPTHLTYELFISITKKCKSDERILLQNWYSEINTDGCRQFQLKEEYRTIPYEKWHDEYLKLLDIIEKCLNSLIQEQKQQQHPVQPSSGDQALLAEMKLHRMSPVEKEVDRALEYSHDRIVAVFREWSSHSSPPNVDSRERLRNVKDRLTMSLSSDNYTTLIVPGKSVNHEIDPDSEDHETYLMKFKNKIFDKMRNLIEEHITNDPDVIKGRKKTVQEIFHEHSTHLRFLQEHQNGQSLVSSSVPDRVRTALLRTFRLGSRHAPFFISGPHGCGKSTLIAELYTRVQQWFATDHPNIKVSRVVRFAAATPRSAYSLELLRVICQQISIIFNIPEGYLPKDASFDPLYINNWFQNLLRRVEDFNNKVLVVFIDDLHKLNPLDCDVVAALSWLPISLPWNVYLVCSTAVPIELLKFTPIQKDRFKSLEYHFDLSLEANATVLHGSEMVSFDGLITERFDFLEGKYGRKSFGRLAALITCSEYGLTETELLELLMPTDDPEVLIETANGNFNFATLLKIRHEMKFLIREKIMSGKILIVWRHPICAIKAKSRYMDLQSERALHTEIANIFFNQYTESSDDSSSENSENTTVSPNRDKDNESRKQSSQPPDDNSTFYNPIAADVSYSIRHVEESWHHLMRSDDTTKFKQIAVCNFDFLLAAVQTVSISYLRCLIEHVRCYILDRDIELIYYTILKSCDVLTRDPMQLGAQLISWLRPISEHDENDNSLLSITVRSATAWCDGYTVPLLVPLTGWLPPPLPSQTRTLTVTGTGPIRDIAVTPSKQHLLIATNSGDVQMWHIMSNSLVHIFKGHNAPVTCMSVTTHSGLLLTGSEDKLMIVWDVSGRERKTQIGEHTGSVICVTSNVNDTLAISGSDDAIIIISNMQTGKLLHRIYHHRGAVTSLKVSPVCDVLISSSLDKTICLWCLENYTLLNCMQLQSPVLRMDISCDSVFLLAHCEDNGLYLRTLATGTELHTLKGHKSKIRTLSTATDGQRAIVGCDDTRALIFDMHSGKLIRSLPPNPGSVTAVFVMDNDDFLITVGGNKITFYSFRNEELYVHPYSHNHRRKRSLKRLTSQRSPGSTKLPPITCFDLSRDSQLAAIASGRSVHVMQINTPQYQMTLDGHTAAVTCVSFAPNGESIVTGAEDKVVNVWGLNLGLVATSFKSHNSSITCAVFLMDSRRVISSDHEGVLHVWLAEAGTILQTIQGPNKYVSSTNNMKFAVCTNGDNSLKIWSLTREDEVYKVSHSDEITCFVITADSLHVITGSRDMSLKVWQATGGKLAQVLVGHSKAVTCVAVSVTNKTQVISGSKDCNLIVWDIHTGEEIHTLAGHLAQVTCVKVSADGTTAVSGSDDKTLIVWETKRGLALTSLQLHVPFTRFDISLECSRILVQLVDSFNLPVICLHNTPASYVKLPTYSAPARDVEDLRPQGPKRQMKRLLKKEVSLDTYTWQKKYGHLTSSVMMAQVDERLKRRFSVSASMEEISKIAEMKTLTSQTNLGPEQAALAQSQHFDQLEALWNKRSPPRRRHNTGLSRQTSLVEDRLESSDEDEYHDERAGMSMSSSVHSVEHLPPGMLRNRPVSLPLDAWNGTCSVEIPTKTTTTTRTHATGSDHSAQPDLVKDLLGGQAKPTDCECVHSRKKRSIFRWRGAKNSKHQKNCKFYEATLGAKSVATTAMLAHSDRCQERNQHTNLHKSQSLHHSFTLSRFFHFKSANNHNCRNVSGPSTSSPINVSTSSGNNHTISHRKSKLSKSCIAQ